MTDTKLEELLKVNSKPVPSQRVWDLLLFNAHDLILNANDFFAYACGDCVELSTCDFKWALPILEKYEFDGIDAIMSYVRREVPVQERLSEGFWVALKAIHELNPMVYSDLRQYTKEELDTKIIKAWWPTQEEIDRVMKERW